MKYTATVNPAKTANTACLVIPVFARKKLSNAAAELDKATRGKIKSFLKKGDFNGKRSQLAWLYDLPYVKSPRILLVGCGDAKTVNKAIYKKLNSAAANAMIEKSVTTCTNYLGTIRNKHLGTGSISKLTPIAFADSTYRFTSFKSKPGTKISLRSCALAMNDKKQLGKARKALATGTAISSGMHLTRDLGNTPPNVCHPTYLADQAKAMGKEFTKMKVEILNEAQMKKLGMHSLLSVSAGSEQPAKLICMHYNGIGTKAGKPVVLVGKGITFDTGGISIKPSPAMDEMKFDMGGAASVFGTMRALAEMGAEVNAIGVVAAAENMPDGKATRPGDVVTTMSGQTVEILNTDAEGRLVLCDALTYVEKYDPASVLDIATLTGACIVALGHQTTGLMSNSQKLANKLLKVGKKIDDRAWQLPLGPEYDEQLKSNFADIPNIGTPGAGTIVAGCFLGRFTNKYKWAHLDIAGTAWKGGAAKGSTGRPVPLLTSYVLSQF